MKIVKYTKPKVVLDLEVVSPEPVRGSTAYFFDMMVAAAASARARKRRR